MFKEILNLKMQLWLADLVGALVCFGIIIVIYFIYFSITTMHKRKNKKKR